MRGIAGLLAGHDARRLLDLVTRASREEREMAARVAEAAGWCGSTPARSRPGMDRPGRASGQG